MTYTFVYFFFNYTATTKIYTLSLHDALPISRLVSEQFPGLLDREKRVEVASGRPIRSEEHTSELQSRGHLVCRLLLEKKNECHTRNRTPTPSSRCRPVPAGR